MRRVQPSRHRPLAVMLGIAVTSCSDSGGTDGTTGSTTAGTPTVGAPGPSLGGAPTGTTDPGTGATNGVVTAGLPSNTTAVAPTDQDPATPGLTGNGQTPSDPAALGPEAPSTDVNQESMTPSGAGGADGTDMVAEAAGGSQDSGGASDVIGGAGGMPAPDQMSSPPSDAEETFGPDIDGSCTESQPAGTSASGSGPYDVVIETNSDPGINEGTIFRPAELGGDEPLPIFVWGQGGCSQNGLSNQAAMAEIASHGYFVVADGTPNGSGNRSMSSNDLPSMGEPLIAYIDWAIEENSKPCSAYYHSLNASKVAANGFSCGGLMATGTSGDPRMTTWGSTSSGSFSVNQALYDAVHTPVLIIEGGPSDIAYENGARDYDNISALGIPIMWFSKDIGHGGDLFSQGGGDFTKINLAWMNWWMKGDESATGKGLLVGASCPYCTDTAWEVKSANLP